MATTFEKFQRLLEELFQLDQADLDFGIYRIMNQMAREGVAILMISSELPEVVGMSDRVYVMREGTIAGELQGEAITQEEIMTLATGVNDTHHQAVHHD